MKRLAAAIALTALLAACASQPKVTGKSNAGTQADYDECRANSSIAAALTPPGQNPDKLREKAMDECMKGKGYVVK